MAEVIAAVAVPLFNALLASLVVTVLAAAAQRNLKAQARQGTAVEAVAR
jgi:hypothetical protein